MNNKNESQTRQFVGDKTERRSGYRDIHLKERRTEQKTNQDHE